jgi:hypothetical protein
VAVLIQVRGIRVSDEEATDLARGLRTYGDPIGIGVAERIERGLLMGTAIIGASRPEAAVLLNVIEARIPARLRELESDLKEYLAAAA